MTVYYSYIKCCNCGGGRAQIESEKESTKNIRIRRNYQERLSEKGGGHRPSSGP